jgi:hypothetical protein
MTEDSIQKSVVQYLRGMLDGAIVHHSRNEGNRAGKKGMLDGVRGKRIGVVAGYPDLICHWRGLTFFVEVKRPKQYLTSAQKDLRGLLEAQGFPYFVARSVDDAVSIARAMKQMEDLQSC